MIMRIVKQQIVLVGLLLAQAGRADSNSNLFNMPLQDLMDIPVRIVSGTPEKISGAAAAVSVITQEDIERSGVQNIPDALRLVPGLDVARLDAHTWAVSSRGFNDIFEDKLLVMIDGRTVYSPLFSGVFWDVQDLMMSDIDHIEVVRGPGATIWGANAVNGVINIITRSAANSQGGYLSAGYGTQEGDFANARYGLSLAPGVFLKTWAKYFNIEPSELPNGSPANDAWSMFHAGMRLEIDHTNGNQISLEASAYSGNEHEVYLVPKPIASVDNVGGVNVLAHWEHQFSEDSQLSIQAYYDRTTRNLAIFAEDRDTEDILAQYNLPLGRRQEVTMGAEYRYTEGVIGNSPYVAFVDPYRALSLYSAFLQDDLAVVPDQVRLILGSKFERNDFTGFEAQPSARLAWTPTPGQTFWTSISRAVRTPSQAEEQVILKTGLSPLPVTGNPNMLSENLLAYEAGYRVKLFTNITVDLTGYYNDYTRLRGEQLNYTRIPVAPFVVPTSIEAANDLEGASYGGELALTYQPLEMWRLQGGLTYCQVNIDGNDAGDTAGTLEGLTPRWEAFLRSSEDLGHGVTFDTTLRYVDSLSFPPSTLPYETYIPSYVTLDARLAWKPWKHVEFSIDGRNLLQSRHLEFAPTDIPTQQTDLLRSVFGTVKFEF